METGSSEKEANNAGWDTELCRAAKTGDVQKVQSLLDGRADLHQTDDYRGGATPLSTAADNGHLAVVEFLISCRANVNMHSGTWTALLWSAYRNRLDISRLLVDAGAHVDVVVGAASCKKGKSPLDLAKEHGNQELIEALQPVMPVTVSITKQGLAATCMSGKALVEIPFLDETNLGMLRAAAQLNCGPSNRVQLISEAGDVLLESFDTVMLGPEISLDPHALELASMKLSDRSNGAEL